MNLLNVVGAQSGWVERALCAQTDPEAFFPEKGGSTREAKMVCRRCPVMAECLEFALSNHERFGIWGGMSERDRRKIEPAPAPQPIRHGTDAGAKAHYRRGEKPCGACGEASRRQKARSRDGLRAAS